MTYSMTAYARHKRAMHVLSALNDWHRRRATEAAIENLDNRLRRDIGWPARIEQPESLHETAARIAMMARR